MTKEEIIELAQKSASVYSTTTNIFHLSPNQLERFAHLVAAKERERCAMVCEGIYTNGDGAEGWLEIAANKIRSLK